MSEAGRANPAAAGPLPSDAVASPCIGTCKLDLRQVCIGCGRTIQEIGAWFRASEDQRRAIVAHARRRLADLPDV